MSIALKCVAAIVVICSAIATSTSAQEDKPDEVQVETAIGQKFVMTLKLIEINLWKADRIGFSLSNTYSSQSFVIDVEVSPEFEKIYKCMEEVEVVKPLGTKVIELQSGKQARSHFEVDRDAYELLTSLKVAEDVVSARISLNTFGGSVASLKNYYLRTQLGKSVLLKPKKLDGYADTEYWIIARVDEPKEEKAE